MVFLFITFIPGILILQILKLNKLNFLKTLLISIGLSIAFLMVFGLIMNVLFLILGIAKPLSEAIFLSSFDIITIFLIIASYKRKENDFYLNMEINFSKSIYWLLPCIFPFLSIIGTYLMNNYNNNLLLLTLFALIPIYVIMVAIKRHEIPKFTYPVAIWCISLSLLMVHGLTSNYINGRDVYSEYISFQSTFMNLNWKMSNYPSALTACLSTSLLPTIYAVLMNYNGVYVYKLIYPIIFSFTPLVVFLFTKKHLKGNYYPFLAVLYFMFQLPFIDESHSMMRQIIAMLFFALVLMIYFDDEIRGYKKGILLIIFSFGVIVSHYTTAYIFFIIMAGLLFMKLPKKYKISLTPTFVLLLFVSIFFWYSQVTNTSFVDMVNVVDRTAHSLVDFFIVESRDESILVTVGQGLSAIPDKIRIYTYDLTFIFIGLGALYSLLRCRKRFESEYLILITISVVLLILFAMLPYINSIYGNARLFIQVAIILAAPFVIGGIFVSKTLRLRNASIILVAILLLQFCNVTFLTDQAFGIPKSMDLNHQGDRYNEFYVHDIELVSSKWLYNSNSYRKDLIIDKTGRTTYGYKVYMDDFSQKRLVYSYLQNYVYISFPIFNLTSTKFEKSYESYIYLSSLNVFNNSFAFIERDKKKASGVNYVDLSKFSFLFDKTQKIYDNGGSQIFYYRGSQT